MPRGVMQWFDVGAGEGRVRAVQREYPAYEGETEAPARAAGARVRFDVQRIEGVRTAVRVRLRPGTRSSPRQRRFANLAGTGRIEEKARKGLTHQRPDVSPMVSGRPVALVHHWLVGADSGRLDVVLPLYAPHAVLHAVDGDRCGRAEIRAYLLDSGLLSRGWNPTPRGVDQLVEAVRHRAGADGGQVSRFRVAHGQIAEQWVHEIA